MTSVWSWRVIGPAPTEWWNFVPTAGKPGSAPRNSLAPDDPARVARRVAQDLPDALGRGLDDGGVQRHGVCDYPTPPWGNRGCGRNRRRRRRGLGAERPRWRRSCSRTPAGTSSCSRSRPTPGGAVRTEELTEPGFHSDVMSAFYPLAAGSPVIDELDLQSHGLRWRHSELVCAHPTTDGTCASLSRDLDETAASLDAFARGRRRRLAPAVRALGADRQAPRPRRCSRPSRRCARCWASSPPSAGPAACSTSCASACCRCGGWARRRSPARAAGACSRATPCTPT